MEALGTVIAIDLETTAQGNKGEYPAWELIYKNSGGETKTITKHVNGLKYNKALANGLAALAPKDDFTIILEKNEGGYWEPKNIFKGHKETEAAPAPAASSGSKTVTKAAAPSSGGGSNWPTSDERKATQTHIIRQSSLGHAVNYVNNTSKKASVGEVINVAKQFEAFVHGVEYDGGELIDIINDDLGID